MNFCKIHRIEIGAEGTFGVLSLNGELLCYTLENTDTRIPEGAYTCKRDRTGKHQYYEVMDVANRSNIEFHPGNTDRDSSGCIILGSFLGSLHGRKAVLRSQDAMQLFMDSLKGAEEFTLWITR